MVTLASHLVRFAFGALGGAASLAGLLALSACSAPPGGSVQSSPAATPAVGAASAPSAPVSPFTGPNGSPGGPRAYGVEELTPIVNRALRGGRDYERGKRTYEMLQCQICHHFGGGVGGIGPDISGVGGRMGTDGILREILEPSAAVSDLFGTKIVTTTSGDEFVGRLTAQDDQFVTLTRNFTIDPATGTATWNGGERVSVRNAEVASIVDSEISPMPPGMINGLREDEIADLLAFLISGGDPSNRMFQPAQPRP